MSASEELLPEDTEIIQEHPIAAAMNYCIHKMLDIQQCAEIFIPAAWEYHDNKAEEVESLFTESDNILKNAKTRQEEIQAAALMQKASMEFERFKTSDLSETLEKSLYINIFSIFDKFTGDLIQELFNRKQELYKQIQRDLKLSELIEAKSIEEIKQKALEKEIESIKRKSYQDQFKDIEKIFSISLTKFKNWPAFIEAAQKRNLLVHCDGVISNQYVKVCSEVNFTHKEPPSIGEKIPMGPNVFIPTTWIIIEVIVMLGQTLWRKSLPDEIEDADNHLHRIIYDFLYMEKWDEAITLSKFAINLPKHSSDQIQKINTINYTIALKGKGGKGIDAAKNIINKIDWSSSIYDFKMAHSIINDDFSKAKEFMIKIGKEGELINEDSYHTWPLFRDFRNTEEFNDAYLEIYKYCYSSRLSEVSDTMKEEITQ